MQQLISIRTWNGSICCATSRVEPLSIESALPFVFLAAGDTRGIRDRPRITSDETAPPRNRRSPSVTSSTGASSSKRPHICLRRRRILLVDFHRGAASPIIRTLLNINPCVEGSSVCPLENRSPHYVPRPRARNTLAERSVYVGAQRTVSDIEREKDNGMPRTVIARARPESFRNLGRSWLTSAREYSHGQMRSNIVQLCGESIIRFGRFLR